MEKTVIFRDVGKIVVQRTMNSLSINEDSVLSFFEPVKKREMDLENPELQVESNIWKRFDGREIPGILGDLETTIYSLCPYVDNSTVIGEIKRIGANKKFTYFEALSVIKESILAGKIDKKQNGVIAYFEIKDEFLLFFAYRRYDGLLSIGIREGNLKIKWCEDYYVCFN